MIVLDNGKKVFPDELEFLINKLNYISDSMIYAIKNERNNLQVEAKLVLDEEYIKQNLNDKSIEELEEMAWSDIKSINKTLPPYKYIKRITVTYEPFEKTSTLKTKRFIELEKIKREHEKK